MAMRIAVAFTIYELEPAGTYIILLPYGLILPSLRETHCRYINTWVRIK